MSTAIEQPVAGPYTGTADTSMLTIEFDRGEHEQLTLLARVSGRISLTDPG